jgi:radical SAM protein with 4Fe4S-binding SPASM domain
MTYQQRIRIQDFQLWKKPSEKQLLLSFDLELTARCNNDCRHCYINLPAGDADAARRELNFEEIASIADEAIELGAVWVLLSGGEPLLRDDFEQIYLMLKRKGLLVTLFTNATLVNETHIALFRKYPPRLVEVSVYGVTEKTYDKVSGRPGSFRAFIRGVDRLVESGIKLRFKAMAMQSNAHELPEIAKFCRTHTTEVFRFDPQLHLRFDRNESRNRMIMSERLSPEQIVALEQGDDERFAALKKECSQMITEESFHTDGDYLFHCGVGDGSCTIGYDGTYRLCSSLWAPGTTYDLRKGSLREAWEVFTPRVRDMRSSRQEYLEKCMSCPIIDLCLWCPAHAELETGELDLPILYFCRVAEARADALRQDSGINRV